MRKIDYLITLAKIKHFRRAAEACHVSQPTLSSAIQHLEDELGVTLFKRGQKFVGLTPEGERILAHAQRLSSNWDALKQEAALCKEQLAGQLKIGAIPTTLAVVPLLTESYRENHPHIRFQIFSQCAEKIIHQLDSFELDFGLTYLNDPRLKGFKTLPLYQERHVLLARQLESDTLQKSLTWQEASKLPLCLLTTNMQNRQLIDAAFREANVKPNVIVETDSIFALYAHVRCAGLFAIVPHSLLALIEMRQEVTAVPLTPTLSREIGLVARREHLEMPVQQATWHLAKKLNLQARFDALIDFVY